jgi:hypothetical protein
LNIRLDADQTTRRRAHGGVDINAIVAKAKKSTHDQ